MPIRNHLSEPNNPKDTYSEFDNVDFVVSFLGRKLVLNSLRLCGNITVNGNTDPVADGLKDIRIDNFVGAHSVVEEVLSSTANQGLLESIQNYPRFVGMMRKAVMDEQSLMNSTFTQEMCAPSQQIARQVLKGNRLQVTGVDESQAQDFCIKPMVMWNRSEGNQFLSYSKTGDITLTLRLNRNEQVIWGSDASLTNTYSITDLRLKYETIDDDGTVQPHIMRSVVTLAQPVTSSFVTISSKVPARACSGVVASFMENDRVSNYSYNNVAQAQLPNVKALSFLFNDSENRFITYEIKNNVDLLNRYIQAYKKSGETHASLQRVEANQGYGIGLNFENFLDLSTQKFTTQITSEVVNTNPYTAFFYFFDQLSL